MNENYKDILGSLALDLGIKLSEAQLDLFWIYLDELWSWNKKTNLTGLKSLEMVIRELVLDSLLASSHLPNDGWLLDIGSGAGFPGIALKIHKPLLKIHLFEANRKKASFLKYAVRLMRLPDIHVFQGRIESDGFLLNKGGYDAVTARAVSDLSLILKWSAPHLKKGGVIINFQGPFFKDSLDESSHTMSQYKIELVSTIPYSLPGSGKNRSLLVFRKV
ncbi:16S rRNA (guanine(527)-N(7))-methyltransferase RsmG [Thermodesulfobacteriota bacterium]